MTSSDPSLDAMAAAPIDDADLRALAAMARMYDAVDPVPIGLVERVQFGLTLDALHAEVAELQRSGGLVGVRSDDITAAQTVTFTSASLSIMITISPSSADRVRIDGWVAPGGGVEVELRSTDGVLRATADSDGRFVFDDVSRGFARLLVRQPGASAGPPVITPSIEL